MKGDGGLEYARLGHHWTIFEVYILHCVSAAPWGGVGDAPWTHPNNPGDVDRPIVDPGSLARPDDGDGLS